MGTSTQPIPRLGPLWFVGAEVLPGRLLRRRPDGLTGHIASAAFQDPGNNFIRTVAVQWDNQAHGTLVDLPLDDVRPWLLPRFRQDVQLVPARILELQNHNWVSEVVLNRMRLQNEQALLQRPVQAPQPLTVVSQPPQARLAAPSTAAPASAAPAAAPPVAPDPRAAATAAAKSAPGGSLALLLGKAGASDAGVPASKVKAVDSKELPAAAPAAAAANGAGPSSPPSDQAGPPKPSADQGRDLASLLRKRASSPAAAAANPVNTPTHGAAPAVEANPQEAGAQRQPPSDSAQRAVSAVRQRAGTPVAQHSPARTAVQVASPMEDSNTATVNAARTLQHLATGPPRAATAARASSFPPEEAEGGGEPSRPAKRSKAATSAPPATAPPAAGLPVKRKLGNVGGAEALQRIFQETGGVGTAGPSMAQGVERPTASDDVLVYRRPLKPTKAAAKNAAKQVGSDDNAHAADDTGRKKKAKKAAAPLTERKKEKTKRAASPAVAPRGGGGAGPSSGRRATPEVAGVGGVVASSDASDTVGLESDREDGWPDYTDTTKWVKGWTGIYYPKRLAQPEGDHEPGYEDPDGGEEFSFEAIMDAYTDEEGYEWVLLKWTGWKLDPGAGPPRLDDTVASKGNWELVQLAFSGRAKKAWTQWKSGASQPNWYKRQAAAHINARDV